MTALQKAKPARTAKTAPAASEVVSGEVVGVKGAGMPTIEFQGRLIAVRPMDEAQFAVLIEAERWMSKAGKEREVIGEVPDDAAADDPRRMRLEKLTQISLNHVGRYMTIIGSLFVDEEDWDFIRDGMADRSISRADAFELPALIIRAHREQTEMRPDNRAAKRAARSR